MESQLLEELQRLRTEVTELKSIVLGNQRQVNNSWFNTESKGLDSKITVLLHDLKISANLKGYALLRDAIKLVINEPDYTRSFTKKLYPVLGKKYETTPANVERSIRHAIEVSYNKGYFHPFYQKHFVDYRPTTTQFIAEIADKLRLEETTK